MLAFQRLPLCGLLPLRRVAGRIDLLIVVCGLALSWGPVTSLAADDEVELLKKTDKPKPAATDTPGEPAPAKPAPTKPATADDPKPAATTPPAKKRPSLDESLERSLGGKPDAKEAEDPVEVLQRALKGMREAQKKLEAKDAGGKTVEIQDRVTNDLGQLIQELEDLLNQPDSPPGGSPPQPKPEQEQSALKKSLAKMLGKGKPQSPTGGGQRPSRQPADRQPMPEKGDNKTADSSPRVDKGTPTKTDLDPREVLVKDVWGHLPPSVRQELLNIYSEKYLPKYDEMVRKFYQSLAEKNRTQGRMP